MTGITGADASARLVELPGWELILEAPVRLVRTFTLPDFRASVDFVRKVAEIAESENHHPDILISYDKVRLELWTHSADGLTESDFIVAAKVNAL